MGSAVLRDRVVFAVPDLIAAGVAGFSVGPMLLLVAGHFTAPLAVPLGLLGAAVAVWLAGLPAGQVERRDVWWTVAAILVAAAWFAYNVVYTGQDVYVTRDPATYTVTGRWLVDHGSLQIHAMPQIFGNPHRGIIYTGSLATVGGDTLNVQGVHLLPAFLGMNGALFGTTALLATNTVITALALLVFFGLARRVVGPVFGLVAMLALALSMPIIFVGRDAYTEPLTLLFLMGALVFVHRAWTSRSPRDWALAGLLGAASTCVRVDSYGALLGLVAAIALFAAVAPPDERRNAARCGAALAAGAVGPLVLGWLDLTHLSRQYYDSQHGHVTHIVELLAAVAVASPVVVWLVWHTRLRSWLASERVRRRVPQVATALLGLVFVALFTRPSWQTTRGPLNHDLENMQAHWHHPVDGTRTYHEQTLRWQALYYGWPTIVLAFAGYAVLITALVRKRSYELAGLLTMGLSISALYLWNDEVTPDQPWAMRRYVPVVIPLFLVAAGAALRAAWHRRGAAAAILRPLVIAFTIYAVVFPLGVANPMRRVREEDGQLQQLRDICTAVGKHGAIIETDAETIFGYGQSVRSFCNVPAIGILAPTSSEIAEVGAAVRAHGLVPYLLGQTAAGTGGDPHRAFSVVHVQRWPNQINVAPTKPDAQEYSVWLSLIDQSGRPEPVPPLRPYR